MKWKIEVSGIIVFKTYLRIFFPKYRFQRWGIPFVKLRGFPNCPPATSDIGNPLSKLLSNVDQIDPLKQFFDILFLCDHLSIPRSLKV